MTDRIDALIDMLTPGFHANHPEPRGQWRLDGNSDRSGVVAVAPDGSEHPIVSLTEVDAGDEWRADYRPRVLALKMASVALETVKA